jgi:DNA-binding PadR family transcriptional regulator
VSKENRSRYAILGALSIMPLSGYGLKKFMERSTSNFWEENFPQIYPTLKQLEQEGLTTSLLIKQEGRQEQRVYSLTEQGREELGRWLRTPPALYQVRRNELLLKLFFANQVEPAITLEHVRGYRTQVMETLKHLEGIEQQLPTLIDESTQPRDRQYWSIVLSYGLLEAKANLAWCDEAIVTLGQLAQEENK